MSENNNAAVNGNIHNLKILPVRNMVVYPLQLTPLIAFTRQSVDLIDDSMLADSKFGIFLIKEPAVKPPVAAEAPADADAETDGEGQGEPSDETEIFQEMESAELPKPQDLYAVGTMVKILRMAKLPNNTVRVIVQGLSRIKITDFVESGKSYLTANVLALKDEILGSDQETALMRTISGLFRETISFVPNFSEELQFLVANVSEPDKLTDLIAANLNVAIQEKQQLLETLSVLQRGEILSRHLGKELEILKLGSQIQSKVKTTMDQKQREYFLRQEMDTIRKELGETDEMAEEVKELRQKIEAAGMPEEAKTAAVKELNRMAKMQPGFAEYTVSRTYLEWLIELPWQKETDDNLDIIKAREILDRDHYDLKEVKEVIIDFLAVKRLKKDAKSNILCLVGPPGVGKTSLGKSIAATMGRKFVRMSLGGIHDEAEIRGHRRTYVGALPGRIIQGIRNAGSKNAVFMLDEIDKVGQDFRGDPSSALLEVLDPEQNSSFRDNYLEVTFDLSRTLFITTANMLDTIPGPLRDRMEIVPLTGYTAEEKVIIAKNFVIPRQIEENGLKKSQLILPDEIILRLILDYTREAGVRSLEREIRTICRKIARKLGEEKKYSPTVSLKDLQEYLGKPRFYADAKERINQPGIATGLAWTPVGGTILFIECTKMPGHEKLIMTGQLGDVMKESATIALNYLRSNSKKFKLKDDEFEKSDIHIHIPEGATPKDGPSAGVTLATSLFSLFSGRKVRYDIAMTGEITLRGKVLPVGGIKEKILAAKQAGIFTIILPEKNQKEIEEIDEKIIKGMKFHYVSAVEEVFAIAVVK